MSDIEISDSNDSSSDFSSDEEIVHFVEKITMPKNIIMNRNNPMLKYNDIQFFNRFRLKKGTVIEILNIIGNELEPRKKNEISISAENKLLTTLRFLATGTFQIVIGDNMRMHKTTVCRIVRSTAQVIAKLSGKYIFMPSSIQEVQSAAVEFFEKFSFPRVIGCIDCTHIKIQGPGGSRSELYRCRKGFFSYNIQCVCNASLKIISIDARWPGSTHDATIFDASLLKLNAEGGTFGHNYLLGDSGYPLRNYLLTPVLNPQTEAQEKYNEAHIRTRNSIERTFGIWKRRFPCLSMGLRCQLKTSMAIIVAAAVLHNIAINEGEEFVDSNSHYEIENAEDYSHQIADINRRSTIRDSVIESYFR